MRVKLAPCETLVSASEDWDIGGKGGVMLCTKCRIDFKKYGDPANLRIDLENESATNVSKRRYEVC